MMLAWARQSVVLEHVIGPIYLALCMSFFFALHFAGFPFYVVYYVATLAVILLTQALEWTLPFEKTWNVADDQFGNELGHTFISAMLGHNFGRIIAVGLFGGIVEAWGTGGAPWWPTELPIVLQVMIAFAIWELGLYWNHRIMHGLTWRFHHLHHKLRRLSWVNSGYGHPVQFVLTSLFDLSFLMLSGAPAEVMIFVLYLSGSVNFLPHANVKMKMGLLNYIFATPEVHRWHHENCPENQGRNYGMQLIIWDLVFRTYYNPKDKDQPRNLGDNGAQPSGYIQQILMPFLPRRPAHWKLMPEHRKRFRRDDETIGLLASEDGLN